MREQILTFLERNSRIDLKELAVILGTDEVTIANEVAKMEQEKIIGPYEGAKPRAVLVTKAEWEERKLNGQYDG